MYYGDLRHKWQCKTWKNEKAYVVTPELWHSSVLFLVGYFLYSEMVYF